MDKAEVVRICEYRSTRSTRDVIESEATSMSEHAGHSAPIGEHSTNSGFDAVNCVVRQIQTRQYFLTDKEGKKALMQYICV